MGQGEGIVPNQSQEVSELLEEGATLKEDLKAPKNLFGKLSQNN